MIFFERPVSTADQSGEGSFFGPCLGSRRAGPRCRKNKTKKLAAAALAVTCAHAAVAAEVKDQPKYQDLAGYWCGPNNVGYWFFDPPSTTLLVYRDGSKINQMTFNKIIVNGSTVRLTWTNFLDLKNDFHADYQLTKTNDLLIENATTEYHRCGKDKVRYEKKSDDGPAGQNGPIEQIGKRMNEHLNDRAIGR
jgi:hypothetical protein